MITLMLHTCTYYYKNRDFTVFGSQWLTSDE